ADADAAPTPAETARAAEPTRVLGGGEREGGSDASADIPLEVALHGYYRARYGWWGNVPVFQRRMDGTRDAEDAHFAFQRLRLNPQVTYGDPDRPIAALYMQIDALDNVVFGDNARITRTPLFAQDPSYTDYEGFDIADSFRLERAWLEVLIPVGQIRVGRMPSQWGLGLLAHDGNGLGEWGDPLFGTTFDRVLFATRPLTVVNALTRGDTRPTPLIFALGYDKLVESPVTSAVDPPAINASLGPFGPIVSSPAEFNESAGGFRSLRNGIPFSTWTGENDDVNELVTALLWKDDDFGPRSTDSLTVGGYYVYRWQRRGGALRDLPDDAQASRVHIIDGYWKLDYGLGPRLPSFYTEGEIIHIRGRTNTVSLAGGCDDEAGVCNETEADLLGGAMRAGVRQDGEYGAVLEWGFASGDGRLFNDPTLSVRPLHPDYHVGLLMYQVGLSTLTAIGLGEEIRPLWSRGGVWNSHYVFPQVRYTILPGIEVHAAFLTAWARALLPTVYTNERADFTDTACGPFEKDCHVGWEVDLAFRFRWGQNDLMRWDTEMGLMRAGQALSGLGEEFLWTVQTRMALVF
ncbi:MAG TPA: hypothetical protein RMG45_20845, partial [Polyangiaceae bacterium LLY-WYZ-15_(1-7)]|nr:hypothetical protein [Polyangiaceae bacterium LLY-WYZ-15_(1-7)]